MYFPDRGCVHTVLTLYVYATGYDACICVLTGSPWRVDVMNPAQVTVVGVDSQLVPVNVPAWFEIRGAVACADGDLVVNITCQSLSLYYHRSVDLLI